MDIGPKTMALYADEIKQAGTVIWNGPVGWFEQPAFSKGTQRHRRGDGGVARPSPSSAAARRPRRSSMGFDEVLGDGEAEAGAADFAEAGDVHAVEAFEDARLVGLGDADAGVGDGEGDFVGVGGGADHNLAARGSVLDGVVEQVLENLREAAAVRGDIRQTIPKLTEIRRSFSAAGRWVVSTSFPQTEKHSGGRSPD